MVDLGTYQFEVLTSFGATIALCAALVGVTLWQGRAAKEALRKMEDQISTEHEEET